MGILSELELVVLGVLSTRQPCTAYAVRKLFLDSPSSHWSGSAGAIYPLVRRLEHKRLIRSVARRGDRRSARLYRLTERGTSQLKKWLLPPLPPASELMNIDPLRVRVSFLGALSPAQRRKVIDEVSVKLERFLREITSRTQGDKQRGNILEYLVGRGAERSVQAQLEWLQEVRGALGS